MGKRTFRSKTVQTPGGQLANGVSVHKQTQTTAKCQNGSTKNGKQFPDKERSLHCTVSIMGTLKKCYDKIKIFTTRSYKTEPTKDLDNDELKSADIHDDGLFPSYFHWILFILTLTFRTWYVSNPSNWWVLHPDEIYQTIEVAHSEVYGYGFRPYEYLPPPGVSPINETSALRQDEINIGMYSLRSFLLPKLLALVMYAGHVVVPDMSPYLIIKYFHVAVTSLLPVTVFKFALALHGSRDIASIAALFVCSSTILNVFGTHTLSNSFISPVLFYSIVPLIKIFKQNKKQVCSKKETNEYKRQREKGRELSTGIGHTNGMLHVPAECHKYTSDNQLIKTIVNGDVNGNTIHARLKHTQTHPSHETGTFNTNGNLKTNGFVLNKNFFGETGSTRNGLVRNTDDIIGAVAAPNGLQRYQNDITGVLASKNGFVHNKNKLDETGSTTNGFVRYKNKLDETGSTTNGFVRYKNKLDETGSTTNGFVPYNNKLDETGSITNGFDSDKNNVNKFITDTKSVRPQIHNKLWQFVLGVLMSLCIYIRVDSVLIPTLSILVLQPTFLLKLFSHVLVLRWYILGCITGVMAGGVDDYVMYGEWFISPKQWFKFNVWRNWSSHVFGTSTPSFYLDKIVDLEPFMLCVIFMFLVSIMTVLTSVTSRSMSLVELRNQNSSLLIFVLLFVMYSLSGHKELRFFQNSLAIMYIAFANSCVSVTRAMFRVFNTQKDILKPYFIYALMSCIVSSHIYNIMQLKDSSLSQWAYGRSSTSHEINVCLDFVRKQDDVTGIYVDHDVYMFGGYSILHRNVPILTRNGFDFYEYSLKDRVLVNESFMRKSSQRTTSLTLFWKLSEFISFHNSPYLLKHLMRRREYNYLVMPVGGQVIDFGYEEVFSFGETNVMKRTYKTRDETRLKKLADSIPVGSNATVLEYEGYHLYRFGLFSKAEKRLLISNRLEPSRLGPFQLLRNMFGSRNETKDFNSVIQACLQVHSFKDCHRPYSIDIINVFS